MYKKLRYEQYFIDTSNDYNQTQKARFKIKYEDVQYTYKNILCHANFEVHYEADRNVIQVNFEETNGKKDWFVNFMFVQKYYDTFVADHKKITLKVHNGWATMFKAMKHRVRYKVDTLLQMHPSAEIEIIGWSLGSGQAMLCAQDLNYNLGVRSHLFTYGSVNPFKTNIFNRRKIKKYLNSCCKEVYNFSDRSDIVTYLPFRIFGFIKFRRVNIEGRFKILGLFNPNLYHTHYDEAKLYRKIYKKEANE